MRPPELVPSTRRPLAVGALACVVLAATAAAQRPAPPRAVDSVQFRGMQWRSIGPNRGGRSIAVAGSARRPLEYYFGAVGGGLWKTTDGGQTWKPVTDGQLGSSSVGAVAVSESNPDVVYIGMGETCIRGNIMQGDGVYRSGDAGKTWAHVGLAGTQAISKIRIDPRNPDVVYVAAFGHPAGRNAERGVYKSTDGGKSWRRVLYRDDKTAAIDLSIDAKNPDVLYAALWEAYRITWQMSSGGPGSGLFKSTDGGEHWTEITRAPGLPAGVIGRIGVSVSPVDGRRVYAAVEAADGGVYRSDDAGETWTDIADGLPSDFGFVMLAHPHRAGTIWVVPLVADAERVPPGGPAGGAPQRRRRLDVAAADRRPARAGVQRRAA